MMVETRTRLLASDPHVEGETRAKFTRALNRFAPHIRNVLVRLVDVNGPRGGVDKLCRATVSMLRGGSVVAEGRGETIGEAVAHAATRARDRVRRRRAMRSYLATTA